jgi:hypothetical protein
MVERHVRRADSAYERTLRRGPDGGCFSLLTEVFTDDCTQKADARGARIRNYAPTTITSYSSNLQQAALYFFKGNQIFALCVCRSTRSLLDK